MKRGEWRRAGFGGVAVALALALGAAMPPRSIVAEEPALTCGRKPAASAANLGKEWYSLYNRRSGIASSLQENGNAELGRFFRACAEKALQRAAEFGDREAQYQHGLRIGLRQPRTDETMAEAYTWIRKAADGGHSRAKLMIASWPWKKP